jgi:cytochrome c2
MRKTQLKRTTIGIVLFTGSIAVLMSVVRVLVFTTEATGAQDGAVLFESKGCVHCHYTDSTETKGGPGLEGLFERDRLPVSGRPVTAENVRKQLNAPYDSMPSYAGRLTGDQIEKLIEYLKGL